MGCARQDRWRRRLGPALLALAAIGSGIAVLCSSPSGASARSESRTEVRPSRALEVPGFLYPGARPKPVRITLRNRSGHPIRIAKIRVLVRSTGAPGCLPSWFRTRPARNSGDLVLGAKDRITLPVRGMRAPTIRMLESGTSQDACQGARLALAYRVRTRPKHARMALADAEQDDRLLSRPAPLLALPAVAALLLGGIALAQRRHSRGGQ
jgi:hypothetical protein